MNGASARQCQGRRNSVNKTTVASFVICDFFFFTRQSVIYFLFILFYILFLFTFYSIFLESLYQ